MIPTVVGTDGDDELLGAAEEVDVIYAGAGNDTIHGGAWIVGVGDYVCGGPGNDALMGGPGDDHMAGGVGNDSVDGGNGGDDLLWGNAGRDSVQDTNDCEFEDPGIDRLWGGSGPDRVCSHDGRDVLHGGDGNDEIYDLTIEITRLYGGAGSDYLQSARWASRDDALHDGRPDFVSGGAGADSALISCKDKFTRSTEDVTYYVPEGANHVCNSN